MHQKCIRNLSQIQPSLPRSQSLKYYKNQNKHTYFFLYYLYLSHIYPKFNLLSLYLTYSNTVKIPNASQIYWLMKMASNWTKSPPVPRYITHKIKDYIPCVHFKVNRVRIWLICTHRWRVNLKKWRFLGFWLMKRASNWTKSPQYLGISPIKLKIIFPVYISRWIGLESDWSVPTGEG